MAQQRPRKWRNNHNAIVYVDAFSINYMDAQKMKYSFLSCSRTSLISLAILTVTVLMVAPLSRAQAKNSTAPAIAKGATSGELVAIKSLKHLVVAADSKLWRVKADYADGIGANVDLEFTDDTNLGIGIFEDHKNTKLANVSLTLDEIVKDYKRSDRRHKSTEVPANFIQPDDAKCSALMLHNLASDNIIICVVQGKDWHGGSIVGYGKKLTPAQLIAVNSMMRSIVRKAQNN